jgi:hypothetical protein
MIVLGLTGRVKAEGLTLWRYEVVAVLIARILSVR